MTVTQAEIRSDSTSSAYGFFAITPHDSTNFTLYPRGIYVGGAGNVVAVTIDDTAVTFIAVPAGSILPIRCKRVNNTSTTATSLVGMY